MIRADIFIHSLINIHLRKLTSNRCTNIIIISIFDMCMTSVVSRKKKVQVVDKSIYYSLFVDKILLIIKCWYELVTLSVIAMMPAGNKMTHVGEL